MAKIYDKNFTEGDLGDLERGDVIVYPASIPGHPDSYLIVSNVDIAGRKVEGQLASTVGVNSVPVKNIIDACKS